MIEFFLWWAIVAFINGMILHALIIYGPIRDKIVIPDAHKYPYYKSNFGGIKTIPALSYCTTYGKKIVRLYWFLIVSSLLSMIFYVTES